ncbi:hypothetical protein JB92DRAFT_2975306 [Gautieria morchelliformis]|nr:hypothetical protein JB92DRAFT_2975306 [Gautieria morchelliformis]
MQPLPKAHSHASPGTPPTAACIPPPRPPSSPTSARGVEMPSPAPPPPPARPRTPPPQPQTQPQTPPQPLLLPAQPTPVLQLQPPKTKIRDVEPDDERSFEDELLSLVDGDDVKPKIAHPAPTTPVPQAAPPRKSFPSGRKAPGSATKATPKPRAPKASKAKAAAAAVRHVSGTSTPVPGSSMPPPSPTPQPAKQMPAVARAKGKLAGTGGGRKKGSTATRSRSLSVKPPEPTPAPVEVEMVQQDDRLYCLCKTPYEEEKIMIACDRCDEWYHPACVGMVEAEVDLVDQFICSSCGAQNSQLNTTYKPRCHRGLNYVVEHDKLPTCYKPARGDFSKYCSDECGVAHMAAKVAQSGYTHAQIYPAVKNARRREGVTIAHGKAKAGADGMDVDAENDEDVDPRAAIFMAMRAADEREIAELQRRLDDVTRVREESELTREIIQKRRRLLDLAEARAMGQFCGWDSRLLKGDKEWAAWVDSEVGRDVLEGGNGDGTDLCGGPAVCPRHKGWQTLRSLEVQLEVDLKSASIENLMKTEQELQHRIDAIEPTAIPPSLQRKCEGGKKQGKQSTR